VAEEGKELEVYRPLTPLQEEIISALKIGNTRAASYRYVGVSKPTFYRWLEENKTFRDTVTRAEASAEVAHVGVIAQAAQAGVARISGMAKEA
jgi:hypothetical protein